MTRLLIALFILSHIVGKSQAKISMASTYFISPNDTINYGDSVYLTVYVKNTGNAPYSGQILVQAKRDTAFGGSCGTSIFSVTNMLPNDSVQTAFNFTPNFAGNFKVDGNGNTIVVWPYIAPGSGDIGDSLRLVLWISNINSVSEIKRNDVLIYPNPVTDLMTIKSLAQSGFKNIIVYDVFARKVKELKFQETIHLSELSAGSYWLVIQSEDKSYRVPFIKD